MHTTIGVDDLEQVMAAGWWPLEHQRLGEWLLRASAGFTGRGNSALVVGDPGLPVTDAVEVVEEFYRRRDLPPRFAVPSASVGDVDGPVAGLLERRGYAVVTPTAVMTAPASTIAAHAEARSRVRFLTEPDEGWLSVYRYRGEALPPAARRLLLSAPHQRLASIEDGGRTVAVGRVAISGGWAGITAMEVAPSHRGRGLARAVLVALASYAAEHDGPWLYLQVSADNAPARALYRSAGFVDHHGYHYRRLG